MLTRYFKFPAQQAFEATLPDGWRAVGESVAPLPAGVDALRIMPHPLTAGGLWSVGPDYTLAQLEAPHVVPGYHVNALMEGAADLPAGWAECQIYPRAPQGIFAGSEAAPHQTVHGA